MKSFLLFAKLLFVGVGFSLQAQTLLNPKLQPKFINPLPIPSVIDARNGGNYTIDVTQFQQNLGLVNPVTGQSLMTTVWGYNGSYPGPTLLTRKGFPIEVLWRNKLTTGNQVLPHLLPIDPSIHWALSNRADFASLGIPIVTHLHGGHTEDASDGLPEAWFTPDFTLKGNGFVKETYHYSNDQEAATIWYHDHALGITRLNVYAGLAGYYLITDENEIALQSSHKIPSSPYDIGLAIQDRMFTEAGQLFYPTMSQASGAENNSLMPEMFGDFILVNGKAWPILEVEPRAYRFRILNGSDSRFYNLDLSNGINFVQIGTDNGLLPAPLHMNKLLIAPGERRDVVIDFSDPRLVGKMIIMGNNAKTPFPKGSNPDPQTTGQIMAFKVTKPLDTNIPMTTLPASLRAPIQPLQTTLSPRKLILFEGQDEMGRLQALLGTVDQGAKKWHDPITEIIQQNNVEIWEIHNLTADAHPIHLHMVTMQLINRQKFSANVDMETGKPVNIRLLGQPRGPDPGEAGWKDTYISYPGEVLRVIAKFDLAGTYVWHCHILSHEDHEMMRPYKVEPMESKTPKNNILAEEDPEIDFKAIPNPFNKQFTLQFKVQEESDLSINIYDSKGALVLTMNRENLKPGLQQVQINGENWSNGIYFCQITIGNKQVFRKMILNK